MEWLWMGIIAGFAVTAAIIAVAAFRVSAMSERSGTPFVPSRDKQKWASRLVA